MSSKMVPCQAEHPEPNATVSTNQGSKHDPCGATSTLNQSVEFPPPPSNEELAPVNDEVSMREIFLVKHLGRIIQ